MQETQGQTTTIGTLVREAVAAHYKADPTEIHDGKGDKTARDVIIYIIKDGLGQTVEEARSAVGVKAVMTVFKARKRVAELLKTDTILSAKIEEIKTSVLAAMMNGAVTDGAQPSVADTNNVKGRIVLQATRRDKSSAQEGQREHGNSPEKAMERSLTLVQQSVAEVFLGASLLKSPNAAEEVSLAREVAVFILWRDLGKTPQEIMSAFDLDLISFYTAVGKIDVLLSQGGDLKLKIREVRNRYSRG